MGLMMVMEDILSIGGRVMDMQRAVYVKIKGVNGMKQIGFGKLCLLCAFYLGNL
jgi:hypothetical protein